MSHSMAHVRMQLALDTRCWQLFSQLLISLATFVGEGNFPQLSLLLATNSATFSDKIKKDVIRIGNGVKRRLVFASAFLHCSLLRS